MINLRSRTTREDVLNGTVEAQRRELQLREPSRRKKGGGEEYSERRFRLRTRPDFTAGFNESGSYSSLEDLQQRLGEYFDGTIADRRTPTASGLALVLGFPDQKSFRKEANKDSEIGMTLTAAITYLETLRNEDLLSGGPATTGIMFDLKNNHNWKDKTETEVIERTDSLTLLVQSLQGRVLRPRILIEEGEFTAVRDVVEPIAVPKYREEDII